MPEFSKESGFHKENAFSLVKFGEDKPVLEVELNELQEIQNYLRELLGENILQNGFLQVPSFAYANSTLTITDGIAVINGRILKIPSLTGSVIEGQTVYLRTWEEVKTHNDKIYKHGNPRLEEIPNKILDGREGEETTRRIQYRYGLVTSIDPQKDNYFTVGKIVSGNLQQQYPIATLKFTNAIATQSQATGGSNDSAIMTPLKTKQAIDKFAGAVLDTHRNSKDNPHNVTKGQVGLGNVGNYGIASKTDAETGTSNEKYMTPLRVREAINALAGDTIEVHTNRTDNPHNVTKGQVGLGNVPNYGVATQSEAQSGTSNTKFMTPQRTKEAIDSLATKETVGLGNVENYGVATQLEAEKGTSNQKFMTPFRTKQAIDVHANNKDIHVTKEKQEMWDKKLEGPVTWNQLEGIE